MEPLPEHYGVTNLTLGGKPYTKTFREPAPYTSKNGLPRSSWSLRSDYPLQYVRFLQNTEALHVAALPEASDVAEQPAFAGPYDCDVSLRDGGACITFSTAEHRREIHISPAQLDDWTGLTETMRARTKANVCGEVGFTDTDIGAAVKKRLGGSHAARAGCQEENDYFLLGVRAFKQHLESQGVKLSGVAAESLFGLLVVYKHPERSQQNLAPSSRFVPHR